MTRCSITNAQLDQVKDAGIENIKVLKRTGVMFADLTDSQVAKLRSMGITVERVQSIKSGISVPILEGGAQTFTPQSLSTIAGFDELRNIASPPLQGRGINIAVLDTGIRESHVQINGRVAYSKNYTSNVMEDAFDHGTGVASIIVSVAPLCNILNMKVLDSDGDGTTEEVIEAIEDCIDLWETEPSIAPVIINLSIGAVEIGNIYVPLRVACRAALENRIWVFAAAGNAGPEPSTVTTPAVERYVFACGSVNPNTLEVSEFSSRGPTVEGIVKPDAVFYGENIQVASAVSDVATIGKSGTSFSTPFISAGALLYLEGLAVYTPLGLINRPASEATGIIEQDYEVQVSAQVLIDERLNDMCVRPEEAPTGKNDDYGNGILSGALIANSITGEIAGVEINTLITGMFAIGIVGLLAKTMVTNGK